MADKQTIVRRMFEEVWTNGKLELLDTFLEKNVVSHDPVNPTVGIPKLREVIQKYRTAFPDLQFHIDDMFTTGDKVVARWHSTGTHRGPLDTIAPTGRSGSVTGIAINRFSGERIAEMFVSWDALGLLQQLGVVTLPGKAAAAGV